MPTRRRSSRKTPLTRSQVLQSAVVLADEHGLEALSMRRLAQQLGVEAMSLYNHVDGKEDVIDGMVDLIAREFQVPGRTKNWRRAMEKRADTTHKILLSHPWATMLLFSRINTGEGMMQYAEKTYSCLVAAGFSFELADHATNAMDNHIYGFTLQEVNTPIDPVEYSTAAETYLHLIPADKYPSINTLANLIIQGKHSGVNQFSFGLKLILDGLENLLDHEPV